MKSPQSSLPTLGYTACFRIEGQKDSEAMKRVFSANELSCDLENLKDLDDLREEDLSKEFVNIGNQFTALIFNQIKEKSVGGKSINGSMFVGLVQQYLEAIKSGNINLESSFNYILKLENNNAVKAALERYEETISKVELLDIITLKSLGQIKTKIGAVPKQFEKS